MKYFVSDGGIDELVRDAVARDHHVDDLALVAFIARKGSIR